MADAVPLLFGRLLVISLFRTLRAPTGGLIWFVAQIARRTLPLFLVLWVAGLWFTPCWPGPWQCRVGALQARKSAIRGAASRYMTTISMASYRWRTGRITPMVAQPMVYLTD